MEQPIDRLHDALETAKLDIYNLAPSTKALRCRIDVDLPQVAIDYTIPSWSQNKGRTPHLWSSTF